MRAAATLTLIALAACAPEPPPDTPRRARELDPCAGTGFVEVAVVDSLLRRPLMFASAHVEGTACHGRTSSGGRILLGPLPPGEHRIAAGAIGRAGGRTVSIAGGDTAFVRIAVEPAYMEISGDVKGPDHEPFEPPDTITVEWMRRNVVPGCFHGCEGPYFDRIWSQIARRPDARAALIETATTGERRSLGTRQAIHALGRLRPPPYDVIARLMVGPDSAVVRGAALAACSARADSLARLAWFKPFDQRVGCGASIAESEPGVRGTYAAEFTCPDCEAIRLELSLDTAGTYRLRREYVGLGEAIVQYGAWRPTDWRRGLQLLGDHDMPWHLSVVDSLTLAFTSDDYRAGDDGLLLRRTTPELAGASTTPCRVGLHHGGIVEVGIDMPWPADRSLHPPTPPPGSYVTTSTGCSAPVLPRLTTHYRARLGPLPPGLHEITLHAPGRPPATDTIHAYAGWRSAESIRLPEP